MARTPDHALRPAVVTALQSSDRALTFRKVQAITGGSDWNLRMAINELVADGIVHKRGRKGIECAYWLTGREFESGKRAAFDASELARVW